MQATLEIPDSLYKKLEERSASGRTTLQEFMVEVLAKGVEDVAPDPFRAAGRRRVKLPLIPSTRPGTMDLSNFDFDDLLT